METALLRVENDVFTAMDNGQIVALVLLDLSAAFDTVDHTISLKRLESFGIFEMALEWCKSYLNNRMQCSCIGNSFSKTSMLNYSVPQGSVLGPQLFVMYTSPIRHIIESFQLQYHTYADDTQLYLSFNPSQRVVDAKLKQIEACVTEIRHWMEMNYLKLNADKTEFMLIGSKNSSTKFMLITSLSVAVTLLLSNVPVI